MFHLSCTFQLNTENLFLNLVPNLSTDPQKLLYWGAGVLHLVSFSEFDSSCPSSDFCMSSAHCIVIKIPSFFPFYPAGNESTSVLMRGLADCWLIRNLQRGKRFASGTDLDSRSEALGWHADNTEPRGLKKPGCSGTMCADLGFTGSERRFSQKRMWDILQDSVQVLDKRVPVRSLSIKLLWK